MIKILLVLILMLLSFYYGLQVGTKKIFPYEQLLSLNSFIKNKNYNPQTVMFGDSLTYGASWNKTEDDFTILNKGINGLQSNELLNIVKEFDTKVKKAFLMIGINDFLNYKEVDEVYENYIHIIKELKKKNMDIFVLSTLYVHKDLNEIINKKVALLNEKLKKFLLKENILYIDLNKKLASKGFLEDEFTNDGIHLNEKAYEIWYKSIEKHL